jgi:mRNA interferase RelE/StbE
MTYRLRLSRRVQADVDALPGHVRQRVRRTIALLAENPRPETAKALYGELKGYYRIRVDAYRIIYTIDDDIVVVEIVRVMKRSSHTYNDLR